MMSAYEVQNITRPDRVAPWFTYSAWVKLYGIPANDIVLTLEGLNRLNNKFMRNDIWNIFNTILIDYRNE